MLLMMMMLIPLMVVVSAAPGAVPPPTDVTLSCQNLKTTVSWKYKQDLQTIFKVEIWPESPKNERHFINTEEHQCDLSHLIWKSHQNYMGFHYVNVTAIQEGKESHPVVSNSLTFNSRTAADTKCSLDFPPVTVTAEASKISVIFSNPFIFYKELKQAEKPDNTLIEFSDVSDHKYFTADCNWNDAFCRYDFVSLNDTEVCVTLSGELSGENHVDRIAFRQTDRICATKTNNVYVIILAVLLIAFALIIGVITYLTYTGFRTKPRNQDETKNLISLNFDKFIGNRQLVSEKEEQFATDIKLIPVKFKDNPPDDDSCSDSSSLPYMTRDQNGAGLMSEDPMKTECSPIKEEPEQQTAYDSPHFIQDLGDGDPILGYGGLNNC